MNIMRKTFSVALTLSFISLLGACATDKTSMTSYDLGSLSKTRDTQKKERLQSLALPAISLAEVNAPAWLDSRHMAYRLSYSNDQQARAYAGSNWTMTPAQLFQQRLTARLSHAGGSVVSASDGALNLPVLRIAMDDFSQVFTSASQSQAHIALRASLFDGRNLLSQKMFDLQIPSTSADAQGGAFALSQASDAIIDEIAVWLSSQATKK